MGDYENYLHPVSHETACAAMDFIECDDSTYLKLRSLLVSSMRAGVSASELGVKIIRILESALESISK